MADGANSNLIPAEQIIEQTDPELLKKLPPGQRERVLRIVQQVATSFEGPLPPPHMLAEYDRLIPNGAERLMKLLEGQTNHRHEQEARFVKAQTILPARGQIIGTVLCIFFGAIGCYLSINGHDGIAGIIFGSLILGLVTVFVLGRTPQSRKEDTNLQRPKGKKSR